MERFFSFASSILAATTSIAAWSLLTIDPTSPLRWLIAVLSSATIACLIARYRILRDEVEAATTRDRSAIESALAREIFRARRYQRPFSAMLVSVPPNALHRLELETRKLIRKTDEVGSWDADRLLLVLAESSAEEAMLLTDRLRNAIEADLRFGVSEYRADDSTKSLIDRLESSLDPAYSKTTLSVSDRDGLMPSSHVQETGTVVASQTRKSES